MWEGEGDVTQRSPRGLLFGSRSLAKRSRCYLARVCYHIRHNKNVTVVRVYVMCALCVVGVVVVVLVLLFLLLFSTNFGRIRARPTSKVTRDAS